MRRCSLHIGAGIGLDAGVPTHRDHPWERDARRSGGAQGIPPPSREVRTASFPRARVRPSAYGGGASAPRATWRSPIAVAIVAAIAIAAMAGLSAPAPLASLPSPSPAVGLPSTSDHTRRRLGVEPALALHRARDAGGLGQDDGTRWLLGPGSRAGRGRTPDRRHRGPRRGGPLLRQRVAAVTATGTQREHRSPPRAIAQSPREVRERQGAVLGEREAGLWAISHAWPSGSVNTPA